MWTRRELKEQAKAALKRNYWKIVLVSALLILLGGGIGSHSASASSVDSNDIVAVVQDREATDNPEETDNSEKNGEGFQTELYDTEDTAGLSAETAAGETQSGAETEQDTDHQSLIIMFLVAIVAFIVIFLIVCVVACAFAAFLYNPVIVGAQRFMVKSVDDKAEVKEVAYSFDHCYLNIVKTMFFMDLYVFLWSLLFIIPGIYKKYQYRMVPYILAEHPQTPYKEALQLSRDMMEGEKWNAFVLDLSFVLWHILGIITCGILEIFYIAPYQNLTNAGLYRALCEKRTAAQEETVYLPEEGTEDR